MVRTSSGAAIPFVLLFTLGLYALSWGTFVLASSALRSARAAVTVSQLVAEAEARLAREVGRGPEAWADSVAIGNTGLRGDSSSVRPWRAEWTRLDREVWLVHVTVWPGEEDLPGPPLGASRLVWVLDPQSRLVALADVTVQDTGAVTITNLPSGVSIEVVDSLMLGLLTVDEVAEGLHRLKGVVTPRIATRSALCDTSIVENLGDPTGSSPCRDIVALRGVDQDLEVRAGTGHVLLAGQGDISLTDGVFLRGLLVTRGTVRVLDGTFEGVIIAGRGVEVAPGSMFVSDRVSALVALEALERVRASGRPLRPIRNLWGG